MLRKTIAFCGAARRLTVIFHRGPHAQMSLRPLVYAFIKFSRRAGDCAVRSVSRNLLSTAVVAYWRMRMTDSGAGVFRVP